MFEQKLHKLICFTCFKNRDDLQKKDVKAVEVDDILALSEHHVNQLMNLQCLITQLLEQHQKLRAENSLLKGAEIQQIFDQSAKVLTGYINDQEQVKVIKKFCSKDFAMPPLPVVPAEPMIDSILIKSEQLQNKLK